MAFSVRQEVGRIEEDFFGESILLAFICAGAECILVLNGLLACLLACLLASVLVFSPTCNRLSL